LLTIGGLSGLTTVAITVLLAQTRVFYAMACDGLLPSIFARIHHRTKTPWVSIIACGEYSIHRST
jgi:APA family basic amino acid/polyamine antiporter